MLEFDRRLPQFALIVVGVFSTGCTNDAPAASRWSQASEAGTDAGVTVRTSEPGASRLADAEPGETVRGEVEVTLLEDLVHGRTRRSVTFVDEAGVRTSLPADAAPDVVVGSHPATARVTESIEGGTTLTLTETSRLDPGGSPPAPVTRRLRVLVIPVYFGQGTLGRAPLASRPPAWFEETINGPGDHDLNGWFLEASFGNVSVTGRSTPWIHLPNFSAPTCQSFPAVQAAAVSAALSIGFDATTYDRYIVVGADADGCGYTGVASGTGVYYLHAGDPPDLATFAYAHELLHTLGLGHADHSRCRQPAGNGTVYVPDTLLPSGVCASDDTADYGDHSSVMGRMDPTSTWVHHPTTREKERLGWISVASGDVAVYSTGGLSTTAWTTATVHRSNQRGNGPILLRVNEDDWNTGTSLFNLTIELRGAFPEFDPLATIWGGQSTLSWLRDVTLRSSRGLVDAIPNQGAGYSDAHWVDAPLPIGPTVVVRPGTGSPGQGSGIEVRALSRTANSVTVAFRRVNRANAAMAQLTTSVDASHNVLASLTNQSSFQLGDSVRVDWGDGTPPLTDTNPLPNRVYTHVYPPYAMSMCVSASLTVIDGEGAWPDVTAVRSFASQPDGPPSCAAPVATSGIPVAPFAEPWVASIKTQHRHRCAGALISPSWVVTSAACAGGASIGDDVVVGSTRLGPETSTAEHAHVDAIHIHPSYVFQLPNIQLDFNVALLHLSTPMSATPVAMNRDPYLPTTCGLLPALQTPYCPAADDVRGFGWSGRSPISVAPGMSAVSNDLAWSDARVVDNTSCSFFGWTPGAPAFCLGDPLAGTGFPVRAALESGAPVVHAGVGANPQPVLVGVAMEASTALPSGFVAATRISAAATWIDNVRAGIYTSGGQPLPN